MEKDENMATLAKTIATDLRKAGLTIEYDGSGNIGKRYRRQDEVGTPYCVTIDHNTIDEASPEYHTVTVRYRDSMKQERVSIIDLPQYIR